MFFAANCSESFFLGGLNRPLVTFVPFVVNSSPLLRLRLWRAKFFAAKTLLLIKKPAWVRPNRALLLIVEVVSPPKVRRIEFTNEK